MGWTRAAPERPPSATDTSVFETIDALVAVEQAREYDQAVALLEALRQRHERLRGLVKRLDGIRR